MKVTSVFQPTLVWLAGLIATLYFGGLKELRSDSFCILTVLYILAQSARLHWWFKYKV